MIIIETPTFTRQITELLPDDLYRKLQEALWVNPTLGALIPGSGGLRKVRWQLPGKGKRGGIRVITTGIHPPYRFTCCWPVARTNRRILRHSS
ncbi:MAG: type II toxin-antitoxin system RelE/ParE family toxin [Pseudomonadota bacterium]